MDRVDKGTRYAVKIAFGVSTVITILTFIYYPTQQLSIWKLVKEYLGIL